MEVEHVNSIGMKFILIPPGEFMMGSPPAELEAALKNVTDWYWLACINSEAPQRKVILTQPIYLGVHEVTQADYEKVMGANPSAFRFADGAMTHYSYNGFRVSLTVDAVKAAIHQPVPPTDEL